MSALTNPNVEKVVRKNIGPDWAKMHTKVGQFSSAWKSMKL